MENLVENLRRTYSGKKVFLTGHTGFKGAWMAFWLEQLGAEVFGYSLEEPGAPATYSALDVRAHLAGERIADLADLKLLKSSIAEFKPDFVFHLAAQALVRHSYKFPLQTIQSNVLGTAHVLEVLRELNCPVACVVVTSDKCYQNLEKNYAYVETDAMGGADIYSMSKGACELVVQSYRKSFFADGSTIRLASARAGNVIGGGDYAEDRLIPDCVRALRENKPVELRFPQAVRPWQHVLEPLSGYLALGAALASSQASSFCEGWNFGPRTGESVTVREMVKSFLEVWGKPDFFSSASEQAWKPHEAILLQLNIEKAKSKLKWAPRWSAVAAIQKTAQWYRAFEEKSRKPGSMRELTAAQVSEYTSTQSL